MPELAGGLASLRWLTGDGFEGRLAILALYDIERAAEIVWSGMYATPQLEWPLLGAATGARVIVKHENHTPTGAFKVRGGMTFMEWLKRTQPAAKGVVTATRGNHGQSIAKAAAAAGLIAKILVPKGNSREKNEAMRSFGAELVVFGDDYDEARIEADRISQDEGLFFVPPFHKELVKGVSTYALELFRAVPDLEAVYVPIGCGSGICGLIEARDALSRATQIIGVVAENACAPKLSVEAGRPMETSSADTFADGVAVRVPVQEALEIYSRGAERIVAVSEEEIVEAVGLYFRATHNVAEGAGAAPLAALMKESSRMAGRRVGLILSGGNIDTDWFADALNGRVPSRADAR